MSDHWALIPAAGVGRRMGTDVPKQYLTLGRQTVLEHSLEALLSHPAIGGAMLVTGVDDGYVGDLALARADKPVWHAAGGRERCHSVLNGLRALEDRGVPGDAWVLVHDAARPCLGQDDLSRLIDEVANADCGGLLAVPVRDTMKRADGQGRVDHTVDREGLWHALTPQMFRRAELQEALAAALAADRPVTDEASAMEFAGHAPRLVEGRADNIKITRPEDLSLARFYLQQQGRL